MDAEASRQDVAERLGQWVGVTDAITLHAEHQSIASVGTTPASALRLTGSLGPEASLSQSRAELVSAIMAGDAAGASVSAGAATGNGGSYAPYRKRYLELQRHLELRVAALRAQIRQALSMASPELAQLARLDAVVEQMLGDRAQKLLSTVPVLLEKRFGDLRKNHPSHAGAETQAAGPGVAAQPDDWRQVFGKDFQQVLLAELEVRLQPVVGLVEAFGNLFKKT